jgi:hypothetical protein
MKFFDFMEEFGDSNTIIQKLRQLSLLRLNDICESCGGEMNERTRINGDGLMFFCAKRTCRKAKSIRNGSFFARSKLSLFNIMLFIHLWAKNYPEKIIIDDFVFSNNTVVDWSRFCRDLCFFHFENDDQIIGGLETVVEIDETLVVKRKYNRGRMLSAGWLFGGIERRTDGAFKCFMRLVYNRSEAHLCHLIREHVAPGTHIITDGWGAYTNLSTMGYTHSVVVHEENFVNPEDRNINTQKIEATWSSLKRFIREHGSNKGPHYIEYLYEYIFRRKFDDVFSAIINVIKLEYSLQ